jgi:hypothetical protein
LLATGRIHDLLAGAEQLAQSRKAPRYAQAAVSNIAGGVLEGLGRLPEAFDYWRAAVDLASLRNEESIHVAIAARVGTLRTARKQDEIRHFSGFERARSSQVNDALGLVEQVLGSLSRRAVEAREVVAELSNPAAESPVPPVLFRMLSSLVEGGEAFPSLIGNPDRVDHVARQFDIPVTSSRDVSNYLSKMIFGTAAGQVIEIMREEVDWTLDRAVGGAGRAS